MEVEKEGKAEARKREELLEEERVAAEKNPGGGTEETEGEKKKKVREEWQINVKRAEEEKKRQDKIQFDKSLAKALALEGNKCETVVTKKVLRRDLTSEELDQEFRKLNGGQIKANARLAVEQIVESRGGVRKETGPGLRMMRAEEESVDGFHLPPRGAGAAKNVEVENVKGFTDKRGKKTLNIPAPVVKEMDLKSGKEEEDFGKEQQNEVRVEIPQDILRVQGGGDV